MRPAQTGFYRGVLANVPVARSRRGLAVSLEAWSAAVMGPALAYAPHYDRTTGLRYAERKGLPTWFCWVAVLLLLGRLAGGAVAVRCG